MFFIGPPLTFFIKGVLFKKPSLMPACIVSLINRPLTLAFHFKKQPKPVKLEGQSIKIMV